MQGNYISDYIKAVVKSGINLNKIKQAANCYKILCEKLDKKTVDEAINIVKNTKKQKSLNYLEILMAYEQDVKITALTMKYNITPVIAKIMIDLNMPYTSAVYAAVIEKFDLKNHPNGKALSRIIVNKKLDDNSDAVIIAERIREQGLVDNPNAVKIVNMVYNFDVPIDLAIEVCQYDDNNYEFKNRDEKYLFHKLRQIYQVKIKVEGKLNIDQEAKKISTILSIKSDKARCLLFCCMGNNWGRNSNFYWNYDQFKEDCANDYSYTEEEARLIGRYTHSSSINTYARGFQIRNGKTYYRSSSFTIALDNDEIMDKNKDEYLPLYMAMNKYSLPKDVIVFRGVNMDTLKRYGINYRDSEEEIKRKLNGYYQDGGFMSTSIVIESEDDFLINDVNFIINVKSGTPCGELSEYSAYEKEYEILITPNVTFIVNDVKKMNNRILIYLTSIPTKSLSYVSGIEDEKEDTNIESKQL